MRVRAGGAADSVAVNEILTNVGARTIVVHGTTYDVATLPALVAVARNAVDEAREVKPSIPRTGDHGIPLHDELRIS